jgi:hypothetical protein
LLETRFEVGGGEVTLQRVPGLFYECLGDAIAKQTHALVVPDHEWVAWWCYRRAADVHTHPGGMRRLAWCLTFGEGVTKDPAQAAAWYEKAADLGDAASKAVLGTMLVDGDPRAGVAQDAARGFAVLQEAAELGQGLALFIVAQCYLTGKGVEQDAAHGVSLVRQVINQEDGNKARAEKTLAICDMTGDGVASDTVQGALWCQKAVTSGDARAVELLAGIRRCDFCGITPARQLCVRCRKVRYCDHQCQLAHWNREGDAHKGPCKEHRRRAAEASQQDEAGGASTSAHK